MDDYNKEKTIVIGHKNPDTDSICSAICYANLKAALTGKDFQPGRARDVYKRQARISGAGKPSCVQP